MPTEARGPILIKLGGAAIDEADDHAALFAAIASLHAAARSRGCAGVVIAHGGGAAVDRHLRRLGVTATRAHGLRVTPDDQIDDVVAVLAGSVNTRLVGLLQRAGAPALGLRLGDGGLARASKLEMNGVDLGRVGMVAGGEPRLVHLLLTAGYLPVISSIGLDEHGRPLNVNADDAAAALARIISASQLVLLTDVAGVLDAEGRLIGELDAPAIEAAIADGVIRDGMIPKVRGALAAAAACGAPVVITSWKDPVSLERLARGELVGTAVRPPRPLADTRRSA